MYSEGRHRGEQHARSGQSKAQVKSTEQVECDEGHATERDRGMPGRVRPVRVLECLRNGGKRAGEKEEEQGVRRMIIEDVVCVCLSEAAVPRSTRGHKEPPQQRIKTEAHGTPLDV